VVISLWNSQYLYTIFDIFRGETPVLASRGALQLSFQFSLSKPKRFSGSMRTSLHIRPLQTRSAPCKVRPMFCTFSQVLAHSDARPFQAGFVPAFFHAVYAPDDVHHIAMD